MASPTLPHHHECDWRRMPAWKFWRRPAPRLGLLGQACESLLEIENFWWCLVYSERLSRHTGLSDRWGGMFGSWRHVHIITLTAWWTEWCGTLRSSGSWYLSVRRMLQSANDSGLGRRSLDERKLVEKENMYLSVLTLCDPALCLRAWTR